MVCNESFFNEIYSKVRAGDRGYLSVMRMADHPRLRYRVFGTLARNGIRLEQCYSLPYTVLGASIARVKLTQDGELSLGKALRLAFGENKAEDPSVQTRLRRLIACDSSQELCQILPSVLRLIESRLENKHLCYRKLYELIALFDVDLQRGRSLLVQGFYNQDTSEQNRQASAGEPSHE